MANDFGVKVSQAGFDVKTASSSNLYFSSSWPIMKIGLQGMLTLTGNPTLDTVNHNFGYPPFVMVWSHNNGFMPLEIGSITSKRVIFNGVNAQSGDTLQYYIFRNPLNINFKADKTLASNISMGLPNTNFGIKFVKPGKDINSKDYRDFTLHSGTKSLMVYQTIYQALSPISGGNYQGINGLKYKTDLPYRPVYFAWYSTDGNSFIPLSAAAQSTPKINYDADGGIILNALNSTGGYGCFYVILDPYFSTNNINIQL